MNNKDVVEVFATAIVDEDETGLELSKFINAKEIIHANQHNDFDSIEISNNVRIVKSENIISQYLNVRYLMIRYLTIPLKCIPVSFPFIGGKTVIELFYIIVGIVISIGIFSKQSTESSGSICAILAGLSVLFALRNNILTLLCGVSFERAMFYHKWAGVFAIITGLIHGYISLWKGDDGDKDKKNDRYDGNRRLDGYDGPPPTSISTFFNAIKDEDNFTGTILLLLMILTACSYLVKKYWFEMFYYFHFIVSFAIFIFALMHDAGFLALCYGVWMADLFLRYVFTLKKSTNVSAVVLDAGVVSLTMLKEFEYKSGQYCFIMIPSLNMFEYHPFSISSSPNERNLSFHVRTLGDWTAKLENHIKSECLKSNKSSPKKSNCSMDIYIEGPFGVSAVDIDNHDYEVLLLISGGIGVTPVQGIFNDLKYQHDSNIRRLKKVIFIWSVRDVGIIDAMHNPETGVRQYKVGFVPNLIKDSHTLIPNTDIYFDEEVFHSEFYLTRYTNLEQVDLSKLDVKDRNNVRFGRPDIADIFNKTALYCTENDINRIAVVTCGPQNMIDDVQRQCNINNCGKISFDLQKEVFDF